MPSSLADDVKPLGQSNSQKSSTEEDLKKIRRILNCCLVELECEICRSLLMEPVWINCGHTFCALCIKQWIVKKSECPKCREEISSPPTRAVSTENLINALYFDGIGKELINNRKELLSQRKSEEDAAYPNKVNPLVQEEVLLFNRK